MPWTGDCEDCDELDYKLDRSPGARERAHSLISYVSNYVSCYVIILGQTWCIQFRCEDTARLRLTFAHVIGLSQGSIPGPTLENISGSRGGYDELFAWVGGIQEIVSKSINWRGGGGGGGGGEFTTFLNHGSATTGIFSAEKNLIRWKSLLIPTGRPRGPPLRCLRGPSSLRQAEDILDMMCLLFRCKSEGLQVGVKFRSTKTCCKAYLITDSATVILLQVAANCSACIQFCCWI